MTYHIIGILDDDVVELTWEDGTLTGDLVAITRIEARVVEIGTGPFGPPTADLVADLADPLSALFIIDEVLDEVGILEGDVPEIETGDPDLVEDEDAEILY